MECCDTQNGLMPVAEAIERLMAAGGRHVPEVESVRLEEALGRVLAEDIRASMDVPPAANSAMDGYAIRVEDLQGAASWNLPVSQRIPAGAAPLPLLPGTVARIFTGAVMPPGADAVIMQENTRIPEAGRVEILHPVMRGENVRGAGQDITCGDRIMRLGDRVGAAAVGMLASLGVARVRVYRRLRVAVVSTGDELVEPGNPLAHPGQIYNSNRYLLGALLRQSGCEVLDAGIIPDRLEDTIRTLVDLSAETDVIVSSGGVSVGEEDHVKTAVESVGELDFWRIAIKPGKPLAFGRVGNTAFIGLPGNPQAVWITFLILARPYLLQRQGQRSRCHIRPVSVAAGFDVSKPLKREEYFRVRIEESDSGLILSKHPNQSSGVLSSSLWADGLACIPAGKTVRAGEMVEFYPFSAFGVA